MARSVGPWGAISAAWIASLGFDLFLHGGLLARLYATPGPFVLPAEAAFRRIPLGYAAFLVLTAALYWLLSRLDVRGAADGGRFGAVAGFVVWGALALGLYSITTAGTGLLVGWWLGQAAELGLAGAVLGAARAGVPRGRMWGGVAGFVVTMFVLTVILQSIGWAPAVKVISCTWDGPSCSCG